MLARHEQARARDARFARRAEDAVEHAVRPRGRGRRLPAPWSADLPPSSSETGIILSAAMWAMCLPVVVPPVKDTRLTSGCLVIASPITEPLPGSTLTMPLRHAGLFADARQFERHQRRDLGRLDHHRVAGGQRRRQLLRFARDRRVPRRDRRDHAHRLVHAHRDEGAARRRDAFFQRLQRGGEELEGAGRARDQVARLADRLAVVQALLLRQRLRAARGSAAPRGAAPRRARAAASAPSRWCGRRGRRASMASSTSARLAARRRAIGSPVAG